MLRLFSTGGADTFIGPPNLDVTGVFENGDDGESALLASTKEMCCKQRRTGNHRLCDTELEYGGSFSLCRHKKVRGST